MCIVLRVIVYLIYTCRLYAMFYTTLNHITCICSFVLIFTSLEFIVVILSLIGYHGRSYPVRIFIIIFSSSVSLSSLFPLSFMSIASVVIYEFSFVERFFVERLCFIFFYWLAKIETLTTGSMLSSQMQPGNLRNNV